MHAFYIPKEIILQAQEGRFQEDHIRIPPTLDQVSSNFCILCGMVSGKITNIVTISIT